MKTPTAFNTPSLRKRGCPEAVVRVDENVHIFITDITAPIEDEVFTKIVINCESPAMAKIVANNWRKAWGL